MVPFCGACTPTKPNHLQYNMQQDLWQLALVPVNAVRAATNLYPLYVSFMPIDPKWVSIMFNYRC